MRSTYSERLHPQVDPGDRHDPTFQSVTHKRHVPCPESKYFQAERGKRIFSEPHVHSDTLTQTLDAVVAPQQHSDMGATRFMKGFMRRQQSNITSGYSTVNADERIATVRSELKQWRRENLIKHSSHAGCNPVTGGSPVLGEATPFQRERLSIRPLEVIRRGEAAAATEREAVRAARAEERLKKLVHEGLVSTKKEWSVAQQMHCYDGYSLPAIDSGAPPVRKTGRAAKHAPGASNGRPF